MKTSWQKWLLLAWSVLFLLSCSDRDPEPKIEDNILVEANLTGSSSAAELKILIQLAGRDIDPALFAHDVDIYNVVYKTTYKDSEIHASGLILLPKTATAVGMISFQHGTIVKHAEAPSVQPENSFEVVSYAALASMGFITVVPDMLGFGETKNMLHPYFVEDPTAQSVVDLIRAGQLLAQEKEVAFNSRLFLVGYSEGGYATLATHKALESDPLEGFDLIASFPGAGGYDLKSLREYIFGLDTYPNPYYLAYLALSYQTHYDQPHLLSLFFNEPYASKIPSLFDGKKSKEEINAALTNKLENLIKAEALMSMDTDPKYSFLLETFEENSLLDWTPTRRVFLYHGDEDTTVPYLTSQVTYEKLLSNGASEENLQLITLPGADHSSALKPYIEDVIDRIQALK